MVESAFDEEQKLLEKWHAKHGYEEFLLKQKESFLRRKWNWILRYIRFKKKEKVVFT